MLIIVKLSHWLHKRKMKQTTLAKLLDKCGLSVWRWTHGITFPPVDQALKISRILNCKIEDIWKIR